MPRPKNTQLRREEIVEGLLSVMSERGYESASVARIAKAAGLTPGLVHYHFHNKQEVLVELVRRLAEAMDERFASRARDAQSARDKLNAFVNAHLEIDPESDPRAVRAWVLIGAEAVRQPEVQALYSESVEQRLDVLRGLFRDALREQGVSGRGATQRASFHAAGVLSAIEGAFQLSAAAPARLPAGFAAPTVRAMVDGLLAAEGSA